MVSRKKKMINGILQTGILMVLSGYLLFFCHMPMYFMEDHIPLFQYIKNADEKDTNLLKQVVLEQLPLYTYTGCQWHENMSLQSDLSVKEIMLAETKDEKNHALLKEQVIEENKKHALQTQENEKEEEKGETEKEENKNIDIESEGKEKKREIDMSLYRDYNKLMEDFYVVDKGTYITPEELNAEWMLNQDLRLESVKSGIQTDGPVVLIYHTHSQEAYADSREGEVMDGVVGAGAVLSQLLENEYGIKTLHHTGQYDVSSRDYAYANVEPKLKEILEEYPSIEVVIDLHRDGVAQGTHLVTEIDGKQVAQFMFFNGLSRLKSTGEIDYLTNPNRSENLAFSFQLQKKCMEYYPGITRNIYLKGYRYNMQYVGKSLLVELGAQTNTREEVVNSLGPLAHVIAMVLLGE